MVKIKKPKIRIKVRGRGKDIIIIVLSILLLASFLTGGLWVKNILINKAFAANVGKKTIDYINKNLLPEGVQATLVSISPKANGLYEIKFKIMEREYNSYVSGDGKILFPEGIPLVVSKSTGDQAQKEIPKKEKADVKLFVMSYCPYGNDAEVAIKPVYDLLKDSANIEVRYIVSKEGDKYTSLHGDQELNQNVRELCVQKYQKDKFWDFVLAANNQGTYENIDSKWEEIARSVGVDIAKIKECQQNEFSLLLDAEIALAEKYGASGSPTLVINDTTYSGERTANAYKEAICSGFTTPPANCSQTISDSTANSTASCE